MAVGNYGLVCHSTDNGTTWAKGTVDKTCTAQGVHGEAEIPFPENHIPCYNTVDVSTGSVVAVAPPNEVFHTSAGDDATVTLRDVGLEYIYQRINGAWRLS